MTLSRVEGISLVLFIWAFLGYLLVQAVVYVREHRAARREQTAATVLHAQGMRVLDGVYDVERDPDALPTRIVAGPRPPRIDRWGGASVSDIHAPLSAADEAALDASIAAHPAGKKRAGR